MATEKVGVYGKWHGTVPIDKSGNPPPRGEWLRARPFRWAVRWFGSDGKRFSNILLEPWQEKSGIFSRVTASVVWAGLCHVSFLG